MKILCPDTGNEIPSEDINVAKDLAYSKYTGTMHTLSELVGGSPSTVDHDEKILGNPPKGCSALRDFGFTRVVLSARNILAGIFLSGFAIAWNSFIWFGFIFNLLTFGSSSSGSAQPTPDQAQSAAEQAQNAANNSGGGAAPPIFLLLFMIPFVLAGIAMTGVALFSLAGKVELWLNGSMSKRRILLGPLPILTKKFVLDEDTKVSAGFSQMQINGRPVPMLHIDSSKPAKISLWMTSGVDEKMAFAEAAIREHVRSLR